MSAAALRIARNLVNHQPELFGLPLIPLGAAIDAWSGHNYSPLLFYLPVTVFVAWFSRATIGWASIALVCIAIIGAHLWSGAASPFGIDALTLSRLAIVLFVFSSIRSFRHSTLALRAAKQRLERLNHEKDLLFGVISHDLRNALTATVTASTLLERLGAHSSPDKIKQYARLGGEAARQAWNLCEDLLEWARLEMDQGAMECGPIDLAAAITRSLDALRGQAAAKGVGLVIECVPPEVWALANRAAIETVLRNLISNAIKFTPAGGRVVVSAIQDGDDVEIAVTDTGVGIPPGRLESLFAPAGAGSTEATDGIVGSGLGLILCRELIARHGGEIAARSTPGEGSRFSFRLPATAPQGRRAA